MDSAPVAFPDVATELARFEELRAVLHRGGAWAHYVLDGSRAIWFPTDKPAPVPGGKRKVYFTVSPSAQIPPTNAKGEVCDQPYRHAQNAYLAAINCLYAEWDAKDFGDDLAAALDHVESLPDRGVPRPSALTCSGGGYQGYWLLDEPFALDSDEARARAAYAQAKWVELVRGDPGVHDLRRILRVPGTWNTKPAYGPDGRLCHFEWSELAYRFGLDELEALLPPPPPPPDPAALEAARERARRRRERDGDDATARAISRYIADRLDAESRDLAMLKQGGRSARLVVAAMRLGSISKSDWGSELTEGEIERALEDAADRCGLVRDYSLRDVQRQIANGLRQGDALIQPNFRTLYPDLFPVATSNGGPPEPPAPPPIEGSSSEPPPKAPKITSRDYIAALEGLGFSFRINQMNEMLEVNGQPISDVQAARIRTAMRDAGFSAGRVMEDAYIARAAESAYHPIRDYLTSCEWDGGDHIADLAAHLDDTHPLVEADGQRRTLSHLWLRRWLIGAAAKAMRGTQNMMLVIAGPQGSGKSYLARWLCSGVPELHLEKRIDPDNKDSIVQLISYWIWEVGELGSTVRRADIEALKQFITTQHVAVRRAYGRHDTRATAVASFIGTINPEGSFLNDPTGNRRYLVTDVAGIDWAYTSLDVAQIWAQARHHAEQGESGLLTRDEAAIQQGINKRYEIDDPIEDSLRHAYELDASQRESAWFVPTAQIVDTLQTRGLRGDTRAISMALSRTLHRLGLEKARPRDERGYYGLRLKVTTRPEPPPPEAVPF